MKSISKSLKTVFVFIALLFAGALFAISPISHSINYNAEVSSTSGSNVLKVSHVPDKTTINLSDEQLKIPFLNNTTAGQKYTIRVIDASGKYHDYNVVAGKNDKPLADGENDYAGITEDDISKTQADFKVINDGATNYLTVVSQASNKYKILYIHKNEADGRIYYSNAYTVNVVGVDYQIDFRQLVGEENNKTISQIETLFPSYVATNSASYTFGEVYAHPVLDKEKEEEDDPTKWEVVKPRFTFNGQHYADGVVDGQNLFVDNGNGTYTLNYLIAGNYAVEYSKPDANNSPVATKKIEVVDNFTTPTKDDITITKPGMPSGVELGNKDITFNRPTLSYNFNYTDKNVGYTIEKITVSQVNGNISFSLENNNRTFDFTTEYLKEHFNIDTTYEALADTYSVTYKIKDVYGNIIEWTEPWGKIGISSKPKIYLTYDYKAFDGEGENKKYVANIEDLDTTVSTEIKAEYGYDQLIFPAVFAEDKISNYDDLLIERYIRSSSGRNYYLDNVRVDSTNYKYVPVTENNGNFRVNYALKNGEDWTFKFDENNLDAYYDRLSQSAVLKLFENESGKDTSELDKDYTLYYRVYVKKATPGASSTASHRNQMVYESGTSAYTFKIVNATEVAKEDTKLKISIASDIVNNQQVKVGNKLTINVTATDSTDTRLSNTLYSYKSFTKKGDATDSFEENAQKAYTKALSTLNNKLGEHSIIKLDAFVTEMVNLGYEGFTVIKANSATQFELEITDSLSGGFNLVALTLNDYGKLKASTIKAIKVANTTEANAPTVADVTYETVATEKNGNNAFWSTGKTTVNQNETIYLPTVAFADGEDEVLGLNVAYYVIPEDENDSIEANNYYNNPYASPYGYYFDGNKIVGGTITTNTVGTYYVVYTAIDDAGNTTISHFSFKVASSTEPTLTVNLTGTGFTGTGTNYTCDANTAIGFESVLTDASTGKELTSTTVVKITSEGLTASRDNTKPNTFIFEQYGEYTVSVEVKYNDKTGTEQSITKTYTINVEFPTMKWTNLDTFTTPAYADVDEVVELNTLMAEHGAYPIKPLKVTYKGPNDSTAKDAEYINGKWVFTPKNKGTYTVTYTAESSASHDNVLTKTIEIKVGDNKAPDIVVGNKSTLTQDITYKNSDIEYVVKLSTNNKILIIEAKQDGKTIYTWTSYQDNLTDHKNLRIIENDNENGIYDRDYRWSNLKVELSSSDNIVTEQGTTEVKEDDITYSVTTYIVNGNGKCTLTLSCEDSYGNTGKETLEFKVVNEAKPTGVDDNVVGIVLVVISVVVLLGVILFFLFTGKKGGSNKNILTKKSNKNNNNLVSSNENEEKVEVEETDAE